MEDDQFNDTSLSYISKIVDFKNTIAQDYFANDTLDVWDLIINRLISLDNDLKNVLHTSNIDMGRAIETELMKCFHLEDKKTVAFLKKLNKEMY